MRDRFAEIYDQNEWEHGSGEGSLPVHTQGYSQFLSHFIKHHNVGSVIDVGCGDWQFSQYIDWTGIQYQGLDVVPRVIANNQQKFATDNIHFTLYDGDLSTLPPADLIIIKDVLQHWSQPAIATFIEQLPRYSLALITNCVNPNGATINTDIKDGDFSYLDLRLPPFNLDLEEMYAFSNRRSLLQRLTSKPRWHKKVLLHRLAT